MAGTSGKSTAGVSSYGGKVGEDSAGGVETWSINLTRLFPLGGEGAGVGNSIKGECRGALAAQTIATKVKLCS